MKRTAIRYCLGLGFAASATMALNGCAYSAMKQSMDQAVLENRLQEIEGRIAEIDSRLGMTEEINKGNRAFSRH